MDEEPIDATVGLGIAQNNSALNSSLNRMEKNLITPNGGSLSKLNSNRNSHKFGSNDRNGAGKGTTFQTPASQLSSNTLATAAEALATAAATNGISVNQLLSQVLIEIFKSIISLNILIMC